jgi:phosphate transport system substrate-binding protein
VTVTLTRKISRTALCAGIAAIALTAGAAQAATPLLETGSSLLYPLFNAWVPDFTAANPGLQVSTASTGSGAGISQAIKGLVQIGASDAYMSDALVAKNPTMLSIPLVISAQAVNYNLPGLNDKNIKLSGPILAGIYAGTITKWNDPAIAKANPGVSLPDHVIVPVHRADGSGDTFIFSQYLAASDKDWAAKYKFGTTVSWAPVTGAIGAKGNAGMLAEITNTPYSIAYIGMSYADKVAAAGLGQAALKNKTGVFVLPTPADVAQAADSVVTTTPPDERISMIFAPGTLAYPIVNYEYAVVNSVQPDADTANNVKTLLNWAITDGNDAKYTTKFHFLALPTAIEILSKTQIAKIHS